MCRWPLLSLFAVLVLQQINADPKGHDLRAPDFSAPGRRISEQKCREYNWERKRHSNETVNMKYPYVGAVGYKREDSTSWSFVCAAFLVSPKFALTTAHCLKPMVYTGLSLPEIVRFGNSNIDGDVPRLDVKISGTVIHPQFKPPLKYYDIALVELQSEVPFTRNTYPACLWTQTSLDGVEYGINPAWGADHSRGEQRKVIDEMKVKVIDQETCSEMAKAIYTRLFPQLQEHHICGDESVSTTLNCHGSAGSPLITTVNLDGKSEDQMPYAFGISDFARGCGNLAIYVRISSFIDWIESHVWPADEGSKIHFENN